MTDKIYQKLGAVMRKVFNDPGLVAAPEVTAKDVRGWDSLNHIRFVLEVEREFGVKFSTGDVSSFRNVGDLAALILRKQS